VNLDQLCRGRVAVWGLGQEGMAMASLLADRGARPALIDDHADDAAARAAAVLGGAPVVMDPAALRWSDLDVVVRAPGVSRYRPELEAARAAGVAVTTAMAVWLEDFSAQRVVAITGTKGKSTTAALTASILRHDGMEVALIGNIGVPVTEMYDRPAVDAYVVEVSSFQAAEVTVTPRVSVLTSLAPDHLDWHGGEERYYRDKLRLIEAGPPGALAVNAASPEAVRRTAGHPDRTLFGPTGRVRVDGSEAIEVDGVPLVDAGRLRVPGQHNVWNLCGAVTAALLLVGVPPSSRAVGAAVDGFDGLPSRCHTVGQREGLTYVDDALASNPFATVASIEAFPGRDLTVIVGGADRGVDVGPLARALAERRPVPTVVVLPPDGGRLAVALAGLPGGGGADVPRHEVVDLAQAVAVARESTAPGGVVLFSPAAPTPEGGGGFGARSRQFIEASGVTG
jgi:UDP-N-acetylmuramoyl-L-alanine---L-glutamate ligase